MNGEKEDEKHSWSSLYIANKTSWKYEIKLPLMLNTREMCTFTYWTTQKFILVSHINVFYKKQNDHVVWWKETRLY